MGRSRFRSARKLDPSFHRTLDALTNQHRTTPNYYSQPYPQVELPLDTPVRDEPPVLGSSTSIPAPSYTRSRSRRIAPITEELTAYASRGGISYEHPYKHVNYNQHSLLASSPAQKYDMHGIRRSRSRSRSGSGSWLGRPIDEGVRKWGPPPPSNPLHMTPSRYWGSLPTKMRLIVLLAGFIIIYYGVFAKHHYFDREASSLRNDVQDLIKEANKTGFMQQLLIDGKVPDIFLEDDSSKKQSSSLSNPPPPQSANDSTSNVKKEEKVPQTEIDSQKEKSEEKEKSESKEKPQEKEMKPEENDASAQKAGNSAEDDDFKRRDEKKSFGKRKKRKTDHRNEKDEDAGDEEIVENAPKEDRRPIMEIIERASDADYGTTPDDPETTEKKKKELAKSFPMGGHSPKDEGLPLGEGNLDPNEPANLINSKSTTAKSGTPSSDQQDAVSKSAISDKHGDANKTIGHSSAAEQSAKEQSLKNEYRNTSIHETDGDKTKNDNGIMVKDGEHGQAEGNEKHLNEKKGNYGRGQMENGNRVGDKGQVTNNTVVQTALAPSAMTQQGVGQAAIAQAPMGQKMNKSTETEVAANSTAVEGYLVDEGDYSTDFQDLNPDRIEKFQLPLLNWHYESISDPGVTQQIFGVGSKLDHVTVYKPLCLDTTKESAVVFEGGTICSGFNRTYGWFLQYCSVMETTSRKEALLAIEEEHKSEDWLTQNAAEIRWVEGLTILQILEKNCGNIAHFAGRILLLQHILENIMAYSIPPRNPLNILIQPTFHIMKRFLYPHNYEFWHKYIFQSLVAPHQYGIGTLGNFLYRESKPRPDKQPIFHLLHNFSVDGSEEKKKYVCFRRAIVPAYLKARFFVTDLEFPSTKPSLQSSIPGAPLIPRDSLRLRERVSALINQKADFEMRTKQIMLLDRTGQRRVFSEQSRPQVLGMIERVAKERGYTFTVTNFDKMTFDKQYNVMKNVAIAIGIHGANLVNSMFMPPLSVLFEIFPYGFQHEMYVNGGNAGLKYRSYMMTDGVPFGGPKVYRSVAQCIKINPKCKVHYRDAVLQPRDEDLAQMERILREAIDWCDALPGGSPVTPYGHR